MQPKRLITLTTALVMAFGLIGISSSAPILGSENTVLAATSGTCYSMIQLERKFGINIGQPRNGRLLDRNERLAGATLYLTKEDIHLLRSQGWFVTVGRSWGSAWAPQKCIPLRKGGWTPAVTRARTCMDVPELDTRFGIVENAGNTVNGLILQYGTSGKPVGAVVNLDTPEKVSYLIKRHWGINGESPTIKSVWPPEGCPFRIDGWVPDTVCHSISELDTLYGVVTDAQGTDNGRIVEDGIVGAVLSLTQDQTTELTGQNWTVLTGDNPDASPAYAPQSCRPLSET